MSYLVNFTLYDVILYVTLYDVTMSHCMMLYVTLYFLNVTFRKFLPYKNIFTGFVALWKPYSDKKQCISLNIIFLLQKHFHRLCGALEALFWKKQCNSPNVMLCNFFITKTFSLNLWNFRSSILTQNNTIHRKSSFVTIYLIKMFSLELRHFGNRILTQNNIFLYK